MTQQQDIEPMAALVGTLVAMSAAARHAGGGMRTAGRRATRGATFLGRRAWASAVHSGQRANLAFRVYRGDQVVYERRPSEYVAAGIVTGMTAAFATVALGRALLRGPDGGPAPTRVRHRLDAVRSSVATRTRWRRSTAPVPAQADQPVDDAGRVTTIPVSA
jgi:hypothetical protein